MVQQHSRCVVQSYVKWLEDSDFDAVCVLCSQTIQEGEVLRLVCYDLFHITCLDKYARSLPQNTAPAGFRCPKCKDPFFPPLNLVSPVADHLKHALRDFSWAREGLGLQRLSDATAGSSSESKTLYLEDADSSAFPFSSPFTSTPRVSHTPSSSIEHPSPSYPSSSYTNPTPVALEMYDHPVSRGGGSRGVATGRGGSDVRVALGDSDDNKYKRKNPLEMFSRWYKQRQRWTLTMDDSTVVMRRYLVLFVLAVLAVVAVIVLMTRVGRGMAERDPNLDWKLNPNLRTQD